ncbi:hypothetical protein GCM10027418_06720 [Mariniluteicoccus endophyticus]
MPDYTYRGIPLYDPLTNTLIKNASVSFVDRNTGAEQPVTTLAGVATQLTSNDVGIVPDFKAPIDRGDLVSGEFSTPITSEEAWVSVLDPRLTDAREPTSHTHRMYEVEGLNSRTIGAGAGLTGGGDLSANRTLAAHFGGSGSATTVARSDHSHQPQTVGNILTAVSPWRTPGNQVLKSVGAVKCLTFTLNPEDPPGVGDRRVATSSVKPSVGAVGTWAIQGGGNNGAVFLAADGSLWLKVDVAFTGTNRVLDCTITWID